MKKIICIIFLFIVALPAFSKGEIEMFVTTMDNERIAFDCYMNARKEVLIIAPGWFMTKDTKQFEDISNEFAKSYDVICMDFRGHGKSSGKFTFGANEIYDIKAVVDFARKKYDKVYLMGFSLGGMSSILYCSKYEGVDKLITISAPSDFSKIENHIWKKEAFIPTIQKWFADIKYAHHEKRNIRIGNIFCKKEKASEAIRFVSVPHLLIAGAKDPTVYPWHTTDLYHKAKGNVKMEVFQNCYHAEDLYRQAPAMFIKTCKDWLDKP